MLLDLGNGRVDAVITDVPGLEFAFVKTPDLVVKDRIKTGEEYSLMMTKNHPLLEKINAIIGDMKKDGSLAAIHKKWFGTDPQADSSTAKVKALPKL
jgi:polar amino acid transport system substrate-binding protein